MHYFCFPKMDKIYPTMKKVIMARETGMVYRDLQEAAAGLGVSVSSVSRMLAEYSGNVRYVDRVFLVREEEKGWTVAVMDCRNSGYLVIGSSPERKIAKRDAVEVKDITAFWHRI